MPFQFPISPSIGQQVLNPTSSAIYTWDGSSWGTTPVTASTATSSSYAVSASEAFSSVTVDTMFRDYFPTRSFVSTNWRSAFTTVGQLGLTAVGGATVGWYNNATPYEGNSMIVCTTAQATTLAAEWTTPTSYIRAEMPATPGVSNVFSFSTLTNRTNWVAIDCWICDPVTGNPVKRLIKNGTEVINSGASIISKTTYMDPWGGYGQFSSGFIWMNYSIPKNLVNQYISNTGTIKLALRPGTNNAESGLWYIGGLAMTSNPFNFLNVNASTNAWLESPSYPESLTFDNSSWNYRSLQRINDGATGTFYVPIMDETKPMIFQLIMAAEGSQGFGLNWVNWNIVAPNAATLDLGRPKKSIIAPSYLNQNAYNFAAGGYIITPEQMQQYKIPASTFNANAGYDYLRFTSNINYLNNTYLSGYIAESLY